MPNATTPLEAFTQASEQLDEVAYYLAKGDRESALIKARIVREKMDKLVELLGE